MKFDIDFFENIKKKLKSEKNIGYFR